MAHFGTFWFAVSSWRLRLGNCPRQLWQRKSGHIVRRCTGKLCSAALHSHTLHCNCSTALPCPHRLCSPSWTLDVGTKPNLWSTLLKTIIWTPIIVFSSEYCPLISYLLIYIFIIGYHPPVYIILCGYFWWFCRHYEYKSVAWYALKSPRIFKDLLQLSESRNWPREEGG